MQKYSFKFTKRINHMKKYLYLFLILAIITNCKPQKKQLMKHHSPYTNLLINESSPYLLQHAHNPVNWHPWGDKALQEAKKNNKLLIISIGYAACHWCHVMEHESFEDTSVAHVMNSFYVPVKVDREEHPDVDKIYMSAVQQLTGRGGWPLNVVALPDGRPVWGGTYFRKNQWLSALKQIAEMWKKEPEKLIEVANQLEEGIKAGEVVRNNDEPLNFSKSIVQKALNFWKNYQDKTFGGFRRAPKFPMPFQYKFLLRAGVQLKDKDILDYVKLSLNKMQEGGIYDHVNGGFARYSTDTKWHIPHFEKMLYDNGQLVSLYSDAYLVFKKDSYKTTVEETLEFIENELMDKTGAFYSSLDADSNNGAGELEEGAYYVFTKEELKNQIGEEDFPLFKKYYNINDYGLWEDGKYHLIKKGEDEDFARRNAISLNKLREKVEGWKNTLKKLRENRPRPRLDDKTLTSWNAIMLNGYIDAYKTFGNPHYLKIALKNASFLKQQQIKPDGSLWHVYKNGKSTIQGYLEDYAWLAKAYINLYEATGEEEWLETAKKIVEYTKTHFLDKNTGMFYFVNNSSKDLLARPMETSDNVIPSSNSIMAENLFKLGHFYEKSEDIYQSAKMIHNILPQVDKYPPGYYYWLNDMLNHLSHFYEIAVLGPKASQKVKKLFQYYIPNKIVAWSDDKSELPLLRDRFKEGETLLYLCVDNACKLPEKNIESIINQIEKTID